jgi:PhzF family phenazine biosynthesis protein
LKTYILNAFTSIEAKGNPTPVVIAENEMTFLEMHTMASAFNMPVTVFSSPQKKNYHYQIHYYTSTGEIPACGHATLAAAKVLHDITGEKFIHFLTNSDVCIGAEIREDIVFLTYPKYEAVTIQPQIESLAALNICEFKNAFLCKQLETLFIELNDSNALRNVLPDFNALVKSDNSIKEVVITSASSDAEYDFLLRSFCPWIGINEDPVTGSVHSVLAHYWSERTGKKNMKAFQASAEGGDVFVNALEETVEIGGRLK